jgi:heme-degrading monooxygenase HmoA
MMQADGNILEIAQLWIRDGRQDAFEAAFSEAQLLIAAMPGYLAHELLHCLERPEEYALLVSWTSVAAHEEGFRKSPQYQQWRALLHHFFEPKTQVAHYSRVAAGSAPG